MRHLGNGPALLLAGLVGLAGALPSAAGAVELRNAGFEEVSGTAPAGWTHPSAGRGYELRAQSTNAIEGTLCARLSWVGEGDPPDFGSLVQTLDARKLRGKRVRFRAALRTEGDAEARLWLRVDRTSFQPGTFDNMWERPVRSATWRMVELEGDIDDDAQALNVGAMINGRGSIFVDAADIEIVGDARRPAEADKPRELSGQAVENLATFARLYGIVRWFHPSDEAARVDWDRVVIGAVPPVEAADGPRELARVLEEIFRPFAPAARVYPTGSPPPLEAEGDGPVREWVHLGFDPGGSAVYKTARIDVQPAELRYKKPSATPPYEIGQGLSAFVPRTVLLDEKGTLPRADQPARWLLPDEVIPDARNRACRIGTLIVAWSVLQNFYPYFEEVPVDWPGELRRTLPRAALDRDTASLLTTLRNLVAAIRDGHARVTHPDEALGLLLPLRLDWVGEELVVVAVNEGSPFGPGDVIEAIDNRPVAELRREKAALISGATPQWVEERLLIELIRCSTEEPKLIRARSAATGAPVEVLVAPKAATDPIPSPERPDAIAEIEPGVWYVDTLRFDPEAFRKALADLAGARGLIFDFRGYPQGLDPQLLFSHLTREAVESPQWLVPLVRKPGHRAVDYVYPDRWKIEPAAPYLSGRKAFLIDAGALSFAESCLGVVEGHKLGALVGETTGGTNGNVTSLKLPCGYTLLWTGMRVLKHDDSPHHGVGITPTTRVRPTRAGIAAGRDEMLEAAVEIVTR